MRVLFAPGRYAGLLTSTQVAAAMAEGWGRGAPHDELTLLPLADGSAGTVDVLARTLGGEQVVTTTLDPLGREVPATLLRLDLPEGPTAVIDAAEAIGPHLLDAHERDAGSASSYGLGDLIRQGVDLDVRRLIIGMGPGVAFDGGAGILAALGGDTTDTLRRGGLALAGLDAVDADCVAAAGQVLAGVETIVATDEDLPLLGLKGVHAMRAEDAGASAQVGQALEAAIGHFVDHLARVHRRMDLISGRPVRFEQMPGAGAGAGAGHVLLALGAHRVVGSTLLAELVGLPEAIRGHDLVVTGTGRLDWEAVRVGVVPEVSRVAGELVTPVTALAAEVLVGRRDTMALGLSGAYALAEGRAERESLLADPVRTLERRAERLARTWSPQR